MGQDFMNYLTWVVYRSVAKQTEPGEEHEERQRERRLNLREEGWPEVPNATEVQTARKWVSDKFEAICTTCKVTVDLDGEGLVKNLTPDPSLLESSLRRPLVPRVLWSPAIEKEDSALRSLLRSLKWDEISRAYFAPPDVSITSESYVQECAIRTLHDWRATLDFLARLHVGDSHNGLGLWLDAAADQTIIDSFNFFITFGRKPNLAHNMLCHLASRARIRTILTTNFDTLLEDAFSQLGEHFEVIPIGIRGELPPPGTVQAQNCIIKLHGALVDTRADLSLDERPTDGDLRRFFEYVRGKPPGRASTSFLPGFLLVCGYSANDPRCVQMIKYLLDADSTTTVLWVCHNNNGLETLGRIFNDRDYPFGKPERDLSSARIIATVTDRTDLLFYELYQRLTLSLPRGGFNYQFSPNVPPHRRFTAPQEKAYTGTLERKRLGPVNRYARRLWNELTRKSKNKVVVADGSTGLMEPMRELFEYMTREERKNGIWLELEDYSDTASLAHELFTIIALRLGRFQLDHARLVPPKPRDSETWKKHVAELLLHWDIAPADWFIVFYGRFGPGGCADWEQRYWGTERKESEYGNFATFLDALRTPKPPKVEQEVGDSKEPEQGFVVLYAPYSPRRHRQDKLRQRKVEQLTDNLRAGQHALHPPASNWKQSVEWEGRARGELEQCGQSGSLQSGDWSRELAKRASRYRVSEKGISLIPLHDCKKNNALFKRKIHFDFVGSSGKQFGQNLEIICKKWLKDACRGDERPKANRISARRALYAATLFRQARHFSAFLSEAVYPCPRRFNIRGIDNDWLRNEDVRKWLEDWNQLSEREESPPEDAGSFFFRKPGAFAWAYRDSRLGLQRMIEGMGPIEFVDGHSTSYASQARAEMHFWIGKWYGRAYRATGHADPLLESLYHFAECIQFCPIAVPFEKDLPDEDPRFYRLRLARRALLQLTKVLRLGRRDLRFWIQRAAGEPWFGTEAARRVIDRFRNVFYELYQNLKEEPSHDSEEWLSDLRWEILTLPQESEDDMRELRFAGNVGGTTLHPALRYPSPSLSDFSPDALLDDKNWHAGLGKQWIKDLCTPNEMCASIELFVLEQIRERFSALMKALDVQSESEEFSRTLDSNLKTWRNETVRAYDPQRLFVLAQVTRELAYRLIMRAKRKHHNLQGDACLVLDAKLARLWVQVCGLCWLTHNLCDELPTALLAREANLRIAACTFYGLALGRLGRFYEAHRWLNEAHAWLSKSEERSEPPDEALIKLRRAEVHIFEALRLRCILVRLQKDLAEQAKQKRKKQPVVTRDWRLIFPEVTEHDALVLNQWQNMYLGEENQEVASTQGALDQFLQIHIAKLDDAWLTLESAERVLSGKSHSSLWWGHLHQFRLRVYATHWTPPKDWPQELPIALAFRKRRDHLAAVRKTYQAGWVASRADPYHAIRLADYGLQAVARLTVLDRAKPHDAQEFVNTLSSHLSQDRSSTDLTDSLLVQYRETVQQNIDGLRGLEESGFIEGCRGLGATVP